MASKQTGRAVKAGLAYDVQAKLDKKRDPEQEQEVAQWIADISGQNKPGNVHYEDWLQNGAVLCNLLNSIEAGSVKNVKTSGGAFLLMQNITNFIGAIQNLGVPVEDTFQTVDLWEKQQIHSVTNSIFALSKALQKNPKYSSITPLGPVAE